eukprot:1141043-Rhodomonas_salina.5
MSGILVCRCHCALSSHPLPTPPTDEGIAATRCGLKTEENCEVVLTTVSCAFAALFVPSWHGLYTAAIQTDIRLYPTAASPDVDDATLPLGCETHPSRPPRTRDRRPLVPATPPCVIFKK